MSNTPNKTNSTANSHNSASASTTVKRLASYFAVIGIDDDLRVIDDGADEKDTGILQLKFEPALVDRFPREDENIEFPNVASFCMVREILLIDLI